MFGFRSDYWFAVLPALLREVDSWPLAVPVKLVFLAETP
jgi:hypothetical protein